MRMRLFATLSVCCRPCGRRSRRGAVRRPPVVRNRATGETYHVEIAASLWDPTPDIVIASEGLGHAGDDVDFVNTLGIEKTKFRQFKIVLRPATKHKFRFEYTPISYTAEAIVTA